MQRRRLGRTDIHVSAVCLGTMTWGQQNSEAEGHRQMDYALGRGVDFWDTAEMYTAHPAPILAPSQIHRLRPPRATHTPTHAIRGA